MNTIIFNFNSKKISCLVQENNKAQRVPIFLLHGLGSDSSDFIQIFNNDYFLEETIIAPDFIGFGESEKPYNYSYDLVEQAEIINDLIDMFNYKKINLVAHSMGGVVAILFAKKYPHKVNKLVVAEPNLNPSYATISSKIVRYGTEDDFKEKYESFKEKFNNTEKISSMRYYNTLNKTTYYSLYRSAASLLMSSKPPFYNEFLNLDLPKYFIKGERSYHQIDENIIKDFSKNNIEFYTIENAGHPMMGDNALKFYETIHRILV